MKENPNLQHGNIHKNTLYCHVVVTLICFICFSNSLENGFVHDDIFAIKNNKDIKPETSVWNIFANDFWGRKLLSPKSHKSYRPLCTLTFRLNYIFCGMNAFGYHLVNLCLHIAVCNLFLFVLMGIVFHDACVSCFAASLFASHPIHVEAVRHIFFVFSKILCRKSYFIGKQ